MIDLRVIELRNSASMAADASALEDGCMTLCGDAGSEPIRDPSLAPVVPAADPDIACESGRAFGRYLLLEHLGSGGMGSVYKAYDPDLNRQIALKIIRQNLAHGEHSGESESLLFREAQALARLAHPNVVAVYDVGRSEGAMFLAMELVRGRTLKSWTSDKIRHWREVVAIFADAGQGLKAVHEAGMIHRDFKPHNVVISDEGRVCILDFGLAATRGLSLVRTSGGEGTTQSQALTTTSATMGRTSGMLVGTPAYMSPEQLLGQEISAKSDQFSFCVSMIEALYGVRPFSGLDPEERLKAIERGWVPPHGRTRSRKVPQRIARVALRGMSCNPHERYDTMQELLVDLAAAARPASQRSLPWIGGLLIAAGAVTAHALVPNEGDVCHEGAVQARNIFSLERSKQAHAAFLATGLGIAHDHWQRVQSGLAAHIAQWSATYSRFCAEARTTASGMEADAKMRCLQARRAELDAMVRAFMDADATTVEQSILAMEKLSPAADCEDTEATDDLFPLPSEARARQRVIELQRRAREIELLAQLGRLHECLEKARELADDAQALGFLPFAADAFIDLADLESSLLHWQSAREHALHALRLAERSGNDATAGIVYSRAIWILGYRLRQLDGLPDLIEHAKVHIDRAGRPDALAADFEHSSGAAFLSLGQMDAAIASFRRTYALVERTLGPEHPHTIMEMQNLGHVLDTANEWEEAEVLYRRALDAETNAFGPIHPRRALIMINLAALFEKLGRFTDARAMAEDTRDLLEQTQSKEPIQASRVCDLLAVLDAHAGRQRSAWRRWTQCYEEHERAREHQGGGLSFPLQRVLLAAAIVDAREDLERYVAEARSAVELARHQANAHPELAGVALTLARVAIVRSDMAEAKTWLATAEGMLSATSRGQRFREALASELWLVHGSLAAMEGDFAKALERHRAGLSALEAEFGEDNPNVIRAKIALAESAWAAGRPALALEELHEAADLLLAAGSAETPAMAAIWGRIGRIHLDLREWSQARVYLERAYAGIDREEMTARDIEEITAALRDARERSKTRVRPLGR